MTEILLEEWNSRLMGFGAFPGRDRADAWQMQKFTEQYVHAAENSRFYRKRFAGMEIGQMQPRDFLRSLPFTFPEDLTANPFDFLCVPQTEVAKVTSLATSGTTGVRKRIFFTAEDLERTIAFFQAGMRNIPSNGRPVLILMPGSAEHSIGRLLQEALIRSGIPSWIGSPDWPVPDIAAAAREAGCLAGIPGEIIFLCRRCPDLRPFSVLLSADYVPASVVSALEKTWHTKVFTHYGLTETGYGCAVQCARRAGHHLRDAELLIEIVDPATGKPAAPGQPGEIVITTLAARAMPLIRYRTGDTGRLLTEPCPCGAIMPGLGRVDGRMENLLSLDNGHTISIHQLDELLFAEPAVRGFTARLHRESGTPVLFITVDAEPLLNPDSLTCRLPPGLRVEWSAAEINPFASRAKRRIEGR